MYNYRSILSKMLKFTYFVGLKFSLFKYGFFLFLSTHIFLNTSIHDFYLHVCICFAGWLVIFKLKQIPNAEKIHQDWHIF